MILSRIKKKISQYFKLDIKVKIHKLKLEKLGSDYGNWIVPQGFLSKDAICYLAGAGEDISFDVAIADKYQCEVFIIDPTPKAKKHFDCLVEKTQKGEKMPINNKDGIFYELKKQTLSHLHYLNIGIWNQTEDIKFYTPQNPDHVSHSIVNLQKTSDYFIAQVKPLAAIMAENGHQKIDLLKLDIEGAEYKVIENLVKEKIDVGVICMEFDEVYNSLDENYWQRIQNVIDSLLNFGYVVVNVDKHYNTTFVKRAIYDSLVK